MRLVIQCSLCGTIHTVGTAVCGTCRASGFRDLRLLFECLSCFRLGLSPTCEPCDRKLPPLAHNGSAPEALPPIEATLEEEVLDAAFEEDLSDFELGLERELSEFELKLDDLPVAELDDEDLRLEDDKDTESKGE